MGWIGNDTKCVLRNGSLELRNHFLNLGNCNFMVLQSRVFLDDGNAVDRSLSIRSWTSMNV